VVRAGPGEPCEVTTSALDVLCYGELLWDFFEADKADKADKDSTSRAFSREIGGASANAAVTLARLGLSVGAAGGVGKDRMGEALRKALESAGVDVTHVLSVDAPTGITFVTRDATGEPSFVPYRTGGADLSLEAAKITPAMGKARYLVISTTSLLPQARAATEKLLAAAVKAKAVVMVDLNLRPHLWPDADLMRKAASTLAGHAAVVKGSEKDLAALAGKRGVSWLEEHAKQATWVLTRGENGAACVGAHGQVNAPTKRVRCIDATGAGDAFTAGVVAVLVRAGAKPGGPEWKDGKLWQRALEIGHALGAKAVSSVGATTGLASISDLKARVGPAKK
jgi:fructokinase